VGKAKGGRDSKDDPAVSDASEAEDHETDTRSDCQSEPSEVPTFLLSGTEKARRVRRNAARCAEQDKLDARINNLVTLSNGQDVTLYLTKGKTQKLVSTRSDSGPSRHCLAHLDNLSQTVSTRYQFTRYRLAVSKRKGTERWFETEEKEVPCCRDVGLHLRF
jgi:hypothetical protein